MKMSYRESYSMDEFDPEEDDYDDMEDYRDHDDVRPPVPPDSDEGLTIRFGCYCVADVSFDRFSACI